MAQIYTTTIDKATHDAVKEIKKRRGVTGGQLIKLGLQVINEGNPLKAQVRELEDANKKMQSKLSQLALKMYQIEEKQEASEREPKEEISFGRK